MREPLANGPRARHFLVLDMERQTDLLIEGHPTGDGAWHITIRDQRTGDVLDDLTDDLSRLPLLRALLRRVPRPLRIA